MAPTWMMPSKTEQQQQGKNKKLQRSAACNLQVPGTRYSTNNEDEKRNQAEKAGCNL